MTNKRNSLYKLIIFLFFIIIICLFLILILKVKIISPKIEPVKLSKYGELNIDKQKYIYVKCHGQWLDQPQYKLALADFGAQNNKVFIVAIKSITFSNDYKAVQRLYSPNIIIIPVEYFLEGRTEFFTLSEDKKCISLFAITKKGNKIKFDSQSSCVLSKN